jgi:UDP-glucuronate decarboxylase
VGKLSIIIRIKSVKKIQIIQEDVQTINHRLHSRGISFKDKDVLVTGGGGFLGSWVCDVLIAQGARVLCLDNLSSGKRDNIDHLTISSSFRFIEHDITNPIFFGNTHSPDNVNIPDVENIDFVLHMASRASPFEFTHYPLSILKTGTIGTYNALGIANSHNANFLFTSTSEVYGNPPKEAVPSSEEYFGNVNPVGPRSCYDESKRAGEAFVMAYILERKINAWIVRIFNTYGPRIRSGKLHGRALPNFVHQALLDENITVFGDGSQTRSFTYIIDEIEGILTDVCTPKAKGMVINVGNDKETTVLELANLIIELTNSNSKIVHYPLPGDDPARRKPLLKRANEILDWKPTIQLKEGLKRTIDWFKTIIDKK